MTGEISMKRFCLAAAILLIFSAYANADLTYTIKKGDTLSRVSKKFNVSVIEIRSLNNLEKSSILKIGQTLTVKMTGPKTYTVRKGESISRIAKKFNIGANELKDINMLDSDLLKPGQKLFLEAEPEIETAKINLEEEIKNILESEEIAQMNAKDRLILFANKFINIPYKFGGTSIMGIDCSAYVQKVYSLIGITIPRSARLQFDEGELVDRDSLSIGDLVFFRTYASFPSHVGIYLGNDLFIHSPSKGKKVRIESLKTPYYIKRFIGGKRFIIDNSEIEITKQLHEG